MKIYAHQPIRAELKLDHETGKLKTKLHTSNEVQPLVSFVVNPKTVFIQRPFPPSYERMYIEEKVINFPRIAQVETVRPSAGHHILKRSTEWSEFTVFVVFLHRMLPIAVPPQLRDSVPERRSASELGTRGAQTKREDDPRPQHLHEEELHDLVATEE